LSPTIITKFQAANLSNLTDKTQV